MRLNIFVGISIIAAACAHARVTKPQAARPLEFPDATVVIQPGGVIMGQEAMRDETRYVSSSIRYEREGDRIFWFEDTRSKLYTGNNGWVVVTSSAVINIQRERRFSHDIFIPPYFIEERNGYTMLRPTGLVLGQTIDAYVKLTDVKQDAKWVRARFCGEKKSSNWNEPPEVFLALMAEKNTRYARIDLALEVLDILERYGRARFNCPLPTDGERDQAIAQGTELTRFVQNRPAPKPL